MRRKKAGLREGPGAPLFCLGLVILLATGGTSFAQGVKRSDLERCASLETAELKLACFELLATIADEKEAQSSIEQDSGGQAKSMGPNGVLADVAASAAKTESPAARSAPAVEQADVSNLTANRGQEQLKPGQDIKDDNGTLNTLVNQVVSGNHDILYFHFANGQVWRQIEPRKFRYPRSGAFDVMVDRGMMGDYRLRLDEKSPMTRIKRVR